MPDPIDPVPTIPLAELGRQNRRAARRNLCHLASPARVSGGGEVWWLAWVHDLTLAGAGLLAGEPVEPGTEVDIELLTQAIARVAVRARVAHATRRTDGNWLVGCAFLQPLSSEELETLL